MTDETLAPEDKAAHGGEQDNGGTSNNIPFRCIFTFLLRTKNFELKVRATVSSVVADHSVSGKPNKRSHRDKAGEDNPAENRHQYDSYRANYSDHQVAVPRCWS